MPAIALRLAGLRQRIPGDVTLVAVSKFHPAEAIMEAYGAGQRVFGESRALEMADKASRLPADIEWHFIGHLQTNKVRNVVPHASLIHSIDSMHLLKAVNAEAAKAGRRVRVLMQLHVALEETKYGFTPEELAEALGPGIFEEYPAIEFAGVMAMASNVDDEERIRRDFAEARACFEALRDGVMKDNPSFRTLSMGMSHDWPIAVAEGANMIRIGTDIFGEREY